MRRFLPFAALFGVAFVLGCQDVGTGPDGLVPQFGGPHQDHGGGDKDNPEGPNVEVTLTGSIMTPSPQPATLTSDGGRVNAFNAGIGFLATLGLTGTLTECQMANDTFGLLDYLTQVLDDQQLNEAGDIQIGFQFFVQRKKGTGQFQVLWRDIGVGNIRVQVGSDNVGEQDDGDPPVETRYLFGLGDGDGGRVEVRRSPSIDDDVQGNDQLICSYVGDDDLEILLNRSP